MWSSDAVNFDSFFVLKISATIYHRISFYEMFFVDVHVISEFQFDVFRMYVSDQRLNEWLCESCCLQNYTVKANKTFNLFEII